MRLGEDPGEDGLPASGAVPGFESFYREHDADARRYARAVLGPRSGELDDAMQDAWSRAWRAWSAPTPERRRAWFLRIVRNSCIDRHRRWAATNLIDVAPVAPPSYDGADLAERILSGLPAALREVLWLREALEFTYAEIADIQAVPIGTVMSRLHTARRRAARLLAREMA